MASPQPPGRGGGQAGPPKMRGRSRGPSSARTSTGTPVALHLPGHTPLALNPSIDGLQKLNVYATKARIYIVGCNQERTQFRVLKIDRTEQKNLDIIDDKVVYSREEIEDVLLMIDAAGGTKNQVLQRKVSAFGIFGFVRFLLGYYLILITSRRRVAMIGTHIIYKVEDTMMIPMFNSSARGTQTPNEAKYLKMFQNVDISSNFYYSYSYDITKPLQCNMHAPSTAELRREAIPKFATISPDEEYVWNHHLLLPFKNKVHPDWVLFCVHGFIAQSNISIFGRSTYVTVIARRSRHFAGTRFLKRGTNDKGYVANAIESEQIVHDASTLSHTNGRYTSYLQYRGSIPVFWAQDHSGMKAKPPISMARIDPFASAAALHFDRLFQKYGTSILVLNLVKKHERRPRESILSEQLTATIRYLNQHLPRRHRLVHQAWDMAKCAKSKDGNVLTQLEQIASNALKETGFFHAGPQLYVTELHKDEVENPAGGLNYAPGRYGRHQRGLLRVNCVDCLDRTNTAQFMLGFCALRHQLHALGLLEKPTPAHLPFDSAACRILEELYEDHGDTMALQYGGSQLVNRIQTYRKTSPFSTHSRDILNTVARYYSNSFTDAEKQAAINVFLGVFEPLKHNKELWTLDTDAFLHMHPVASPVACPRPNYVRWFRTHLDEPPTIGQFKIGAVRDLSESELDKYTQTTPVEQETLEPVEQPSPPRQQIEEARRRRSAKGPASPPGGPMLPSPVPDPKGPDGLGDMPALFTNVGPLSSKLRPPPKGVSSLALARRDLDVICEFTLKRSRELQKVTNPKERFETFVKHLMDMWGVEARPTPEQLVIAGLFVSARYGHHWSPFTIPPKPKPPRPRRAQLQWVYHGAFYSARNLTHFDYQYPMRTTATDTAADKDGPASPFRASTAPDAAPVVFQGHTQPTESRVAGADQEEEEDELDDTMSAMNADGSWVKVDSDVLTKAKKDAAAEQQARLRVHLPTMQGTYGVCLDAPGVDDLNTFSRHVDVSSFREHLLEHADKKAAMFQHTLDSSMVIGTPQKASRMSAPPASPAWSVASSHHTLRPFTKSDSLLAFSLARRRDLYGSSSLPRHSLPGFGHMPLSVSPVRPERPQPEEVEPALGVTSHQAALAPAAPPEQDLETPIPTPFTPLDDDTTARYSTYCQLGQDGCSFYAPPDAELYGHYKEVSTVSSSASTARGAKAR